MHAPYALRIRTVSNSNDLFGAYDPSTALSIRTVTIRTDRTDRNTLCSDHHNEIHAPYVLRIRTVSNADGLYGVYDPSTALNGP